MLVVFDWKRQRVICMEDVLPSIMKIFSSDSSIVWTKNGARRIASETLGKGRGVIDESATDAHRFSK